MTNLTRHYDSSDEARLNRLYKRFRQHHVDIQRLWKLCAPLGDGVPQGGGPVFEPPFDVPPSGGTALTGTPCKQRYCVSRYAGSVYEVSQPPKINWTSETDAEGAPDGSGAIVSLGNFFPSNPLLSEDYSFSIPGDALLVSVRAYATCRLSEVGGLVGVSNERWLHLSGTNKISFTVPVLPIKVSHSDWLERLIGEMSASQLALGGITPSVVSSSGFGLNCAFAAGGSPIVPQTIHIDAIRLEICYDLYTLSGTCSENPG